jgi:leader peptidase (prepilin peptidase) / N-methyltransferase
MYIVYSVIMFLFGALLASFYQLIAQRIPNSESISGRSYCPKCHHSLRLIDVLPLFGFLINRGKCHFCQARIPISHLIVEVMGGALFVLSYLFLGFTLELMVALILISVLLIESISDYERTIVIDRIWFIGLVPVIVIRIIQGDFLTYLLSAGVLFGFLYLVSTIGKSIAKKEVLGGGDVKLYLFIGFTLTLIPAFLSLFLASLSGLFYSLIRKNKTDRMIALVPCIFFGVLIAYFFGNAMIEWYLNLLGM